MTERATGRILRSLSGFYDVQTDKGLVTCRARGILRKGSNSPLTGDLVEITAERGKGMVEKILPRKNSFIRPAVANMDALVIFAANVNPVTEPFLIDRVAAIAGDQGVQVILCVNKCDLDPAMDLVDIYEKAGFAVEYNATGNAYTKEEFYEKTMDADGVIIGVEQVDKAYIDAHPRLKAVVKFGVGTDNIDIPYCQEKGIFVGRTAGSNAQSVAETAISFLFADSKNLFESIADTRAGQWTKRTGYELAGKTIGIVGFGAIGRKVAQMAQGLGMRILAYEPYAAVQTETVAVVDKETLLRDSDFVSLHLPLTRETKDFITLAEMEKMKSGAVLINTARGGIVNEQDLYTALSQGMIRAAYFDVLTSEPPQENEPLMTLPNFYLTPHIASRSMEAEKNTADMATQVMLDALQARK